MALKDAFPHETELTNEDLSTLDKQFRTLKEKIKAGEYVLEALREGDVEYEAARDQTTLTVTIKPAAANSEASIKSMQFTFAHDYRAQRNFDDTTYYGGVRTSFRIAAANGTYTYGPEERSLPEKRSSLLKDVRELGCDLLAPAEWTAHLRKKYPEDFAEEQKAANRKTQIKKDLAL